MSKPRPSRRDILKWGSLGASASLIFGVFASTKKTKKKWNASTEMKMRTLGRTKLKVSEIGMGTAGATKPEVLRYALSKGINYIDTAPDYVSGYSEELIGKVMKKDRQKFVLTTKWHPWAKTSKKAMMESLNKSLKRLQTDYVDCLMVHNVSKQSGGESIERLQNPDLYEAYELAKKQGKVRYTGVSGHGGDLMSVMEWVIQKSYFDVILMRYNFMQYKGQQELIKKAKAKGIGVIAMKTLSGAKGESDPKLYRGAGATMKQAALKWVLKNPEVSNLVITMTDKAQVDEYASVSGSTLSLEDESVLQYYAKHYGDQVCSFCNQCEPSCPYGLPVADILRYYMYYENYHLRDTARLAYASLPQSKQASACTACAAPCEPACEGGVKIRREMVKAHRVLRSVDTPFYG